MKETLISLETAKLAKEKGFKKETKFSYQQPVVTKRDTNTKEVRDYKIERTNYQYTSFTEISYPNESFYAPTQSILQKWVREVHKIEISIEPVWKDKEMTSTEYIPWVMYSKEEHHLPDEDPLYFKTYEEALEYALVEALETIKTKRKFYRVCNIETKQGLWYAYNGLFTGLIHKDFVFCQNNSLKMDFDPEIVGWLSATDNLEDLYKWFTKEDILELQKFGWYIHEFEAKDYKFYERFQHLIINQETSKLIRKIEL